MTSLAIIFVLLFLSLPLIYVSIDYFYNKYKSEKLKKNVMQIYDLWKKDIIKTPINFDFLSKVKCVRKGEAYLFTYTFFDSSILYLTFQGSVVYVNYKGDKYKVVDKKLSNLYNDYADYLIDLHNEILKTKIKTENRNTKNNKEPDKKENKNSKHPKWQLYQTLVETVRKRKQDLDKIPKTDPSYSQLKNELDTAENKMKLFKDKYNF